MSNIKDREGDTLSEQVLRGAFEECKAMFESSPFDDVETHLGDTLDQLTSSQKRGAMERLQKICDGLGIHTSFKTERDVRRIIAVAAYWEASVDAFALEMSSGDSARERRWIELEELSGLHRDDVNKLADYLGERERPGP